MQQNQYKWWANWSNLTFFAVAPGYAADSPIPACGSCLSLIPSGLGNIRVAVLIAGRPVMGQTRGVGATESGYLENENRTGAVSLVFKQAPSSATFNDTVVYQ
jgi:hypothetical protein